MNTGIGFSSQLCAVENERQVMLKGQLIQCRANVTSQPGKYLNGMPRGGVAI